MGPDAEERAAERPAVVLLARDARFAGVARLLLARHGFQVHTTDDAREALERLRRHAGQVLVVDAGDSFVAVARVVAAIEAMSHPVGVVVVADARAPEAVHHLNVLPKWQVTGQLAAEVHRAHAASLAGGEPTSG